jgi:DNA-binding NtrC family response regulator
MPQKGWNRDMPRILIVDDESSILSVLTVVLQTANYEVIATCEGERAKELIVTEKFDLMLSDIRMAPIGGIELLTTAHEHRPEMPVIMLTAFSSVETAMEAMKLGAFDYIRKPFKVDQLLTTIQKALEYSQRHSNDEQTGTDITFEVKYCLGNLVAESPAMKTACQLIEKVSPVDTPVLIYGDKGTGRGTVAEIIHALSQRKDGPLITLECDAVEQENIGKALFGDTESSEAGLFEKADGGSLFIDNIELLPMNVQTLFLDAINDKQITEIGGTKTTPVNVRIIAATRDPLESRTKDGTFREDLYYRLCVLPIQIPALKDRVEDIIPLACHFIKMEIGDAEPPAIDPEVAGILESYSWPGNAFELEAVIKHAMQNPVDGKLVKDSLPPSMADTPVSKDRHSSTSDVDSYKGKSLQAFLKDKKQEYLKQVLNHRNDK